MVGSVPVLTSESTQHQKHLFTGLSVRWLPTAPENGQSDRQSLEQALRADPNTPPPRAPSSSTTTKASTPGGFVPGELAGFQQASRSRNAYTAGTGQQTQSQGPRQGAQPPARHPLAGHNQRVGGPTSMSHTSTASAATQRQDHDATERTVANTSL